MKCNHLIPHEIKPSTGPRDAWIKLEMYRRGWFSVGYCEAYYPQWVYDGIGKEFDGVPGVTDTQARADLDGILSDTNKPRRGE